VHSPDLVALFQSGLSIREISRRSGQQFETVRSCLIRAGVHLVKHKRVVDGMATCKSCQVRKSVDEFPALLGGQVPMPKLSERIEPCVPTSENELRLKPIPDSLASAERQMCHLRSNGRASVGSWASVPIGT